MERFVRDPLRTVGHIGWAATLLLLIAVFGLGAPDWVFIPIGVVAWMLAMQVNLRAERQRQKHRAD